MIVVSSVRGLHWRYFVGASQDKKPIKMSLRHNPRPLFRATLPGLADALRDLARSLDQSDGMRCGVMAHQQHSAGDQAKRHDGKDQRPVRERVARRPLRVPEMAIP